MARVLVTRPQPLAGETAARLSACGHDVIVSPLLEPAPVAWEPPSERIDALLFTSPQGPRFAGPTAEPYRSLPVFAIGERTAAAACAAGFADVRNAGGTVAALYEAAAAAGVARALHLAGVHRTEVEAPAGFQLIVRAVYEARLAKLSPTAVAALRAGEVDWALLFSSRTAGRFAKLVDDLGVSRTDLAIAAISPAALAAAGAGWRRAAAAGAPNEAGILAAAGLACDKPGQALGACGRLT
jgi:uroporphyrinogen-III synthase